MLIKKNWPYILILLLLVLITYTNSLNNAFLSDDLAEIVHKPEIANFSRVFQFPFGPIRHIIYWTAFHMDGLNPAVFRTTNILFHLGNTVLVYFLLILISKSKKISFITTAIFAVHPAITEGIVWISGGMYAQYTFFFLLSFIFYLLSKNSKKFYFFSIISYLFSFMSHNAMPFGLVLTFLLYEFSFGNIGKNWTKSIPYFLIFTVYLIYNLYGLPTRETTLQSIHYQERGVDNLFVLLPVAISSYLELIFFPKTLTLYHSELNFGPVNFAIRVAVTLIFLVAIGFSFKKNKFLFFWLSFFLIALSPTLTPFRLNWIVAERYLYLPILGILACLGSGLIKLSQMIKFKKADYLLTLLIIILLSARTIIRNIDWKNEDNLWIATGKISPSSPNTHNNLGDVYGRWGDKQRSLQEFQTAIALKPNYADAYHNLANVYREVGQIDKALENYQNALKFNPNLWQSHQNIAALYFEQKQYDLALENIQKAILINPKNINLRLNLGVIYLTSGNKEKAKEVFSLVLSANPQNQFAQAGLAEASK